jgi:hypothetical protein
MTRRRISVVRAYLLLSTETSGILVYRIGFACETSWTDVYIRGEEEHGRFASFPNKTDFKKWLKDQPLELDELTLETRIEPEPVENCLHSVKLQIESILKAVGTTDYVAYLTGKGNFREKVAPYYKMNRKDSRKPFHYDAIREYLVKRYGAIVIDGEEADDALGIMQTGEVEDTIICTIDKDLDCIAGPHYNFVNDEMYEVSEVEANRNFYSQMITGDATDNIPGIFKITGTRDSKKFHTPLQEMEDPREMWTHVVHTYLTAYVKQGSACTDLPAIREHVDSKLREIGQLLWIRRVPDEVWEPPSFEGE